MYMKKIIGSYLLVFLLMIVSLQSKGMEGNASTSSNQRKIAYVANILSDYLL